jgi:putative membrane protein
MNKLVFKYISIILAIYLASMLSGAVHVGSLGAVLVMGAVLLLVNLLIKPFLLLITLPLNILTLACSASWSTR